MRASLFLSLSLCFQSRPAQLTRRSSGAVSLAPTRWRVCVVAATVCRAATSAESLRLHRPHGAQPLQTNLDGTADADVRTREACSYCARLNKVPRSHCVGHVLGTQHEASTSQESKQQGTHAQRLCTSSDL